MKTNPEYNREWRAKNAEYDKARKRQWYLENRAKLVEKAKQRLSRVRQQDGPVYRVGATKSYLIADGRVYFNSKLGFSEDEILEIALAMRRAARDAAKNLVHGETGKSYQPKRAKKNSGPSPS